MVIIRIQRKNKPEEFVRNRDGELTTDESRAYRFDSQSEAVELCLKKSKERRHSKVLWWVENLPRDVNIWIDKEFK